MSRGLGKVQREFLAAMLSLEEKAARHATPDNPPIFFVWAILQQFHPRPLRRRREKMKGIRYEVDPSGVLAGLERRGLVRRTGGQGDGAAGLTEQGNAVVLCVKSSLRTPGTTD